MNFKRSAEPETECCYNCTHFYQHYSKEGYEIYAGHCSYPRIKPRNPGDTCQNFERKYKTGQ